MTVASIETLQAKHLAGQAVLVRVDAADNVKLYDALPTLAYACEAGARVVVATHCGLGPDAAPRVDAIAARLSDLLGRPVGKLENWTGEGGRPVINQLADGAILMLENLAFEAGETTGDETLAGALSRLADIYCNEAFGLAHEFRASTVAVAKRAKQAVAGITFERELTMLDVMLRDPRPPSLALLSGEISKDKMLLAEEVAGRVDRTLLAGQLAFPYLIANGRLRRHAAVTDEMVVIAERMLATARDRKHTLDTPADHTVVEHGDFERLSRGERVLPSALQNVAENQLEPDFVIGDTAKRRAGARAIGSVRRERSFGTGPSASAKSTSSVKAAGFWPTKLRTAPGRRCIARWCAVRAWFPRFAASTFPPSASGISPTPAARRCTISPAVPFPLSKF